MNKTKLVSIPNYKGQFYCDCGCGLELITTTDTKQWAWLDHSKQRISVDYRTRRIAKVAHDTANIVWSATGQERDK